jgi:hypothetical protein
MADEQTPAPAPKPKWKKYAVIVATIILGGLVQQGYINADIMSKIVEMLASIGLAQ